MNRKLLISVVLAMYCQWMAAQTTVTGTVVDTHGQPMPGARVQVKGATESVLTAMDGTFVITMPNANAILQADYVGWQRTTQRGKDGMVIKMSKDSWMRPDKYRWFVAANVAVPEVSFERLVPGLMFGRVKNLGWYVKGQFNGMEKDVVDYVRESEWYTGKDKRLYWSISAGGMARIWRHFYLYAGAGYVDRGVYWQFQNGEYLMTPDSYEGVLLEAGLKWRLHRFFIYGGVQGCYDETEIKPFDDTWKCCVGNFGVGLYF